MKPTYVAGLAAAVLVFGLWRLFGPRGPLGEGDCRGGASPTIEWRAATRPTAAVIFSSASQIDPDVVPHVPLVRLRHTGTRAYGDKCDSEHKHIHQPVLDAVRANGGNAWFHAKSHLISAETSEVVTTAALAHTGPMPTALRQRYFPHDRAALIVYVYPDSVAARGGLAVMDVPVTVAGRLVPTELDPDQAFRDAVNAVPRRSDVEIEVVRGGAIKTLRLRRPAEGIYGFESQTVVILEPAP